LEKSSATAIWQLGWVVKRKPGSGNCHCQKSNFDTDSLSQSDWSRRWIDWIFKWDIEKKGFIGAREK
jgi:hypothetical protein